MSDYLLIIGDREALAWVLGEGRMAFPGARRAAALSLEPGDALFLYTTRGCFKNPTRDRGRVIGKATVASVPEVVDPPRTVSGREYSVECRIELISLTPLHDGVELAPLVHHLEAFPDPDSWSARVRRTLLPLGPSDSRLITRRLQRMAGPPPDSVSEYLVFAPS